MLSIKTQMRHSNTHTHTEQLQANAFCKEFKIEASKQQNAPHREREKGGREKELILTNSRTQYRNSFKHKNDDQLFLRWRCHCKSKTDPSRNTK